MVKVSEILLATQADGAQSVSLGNFDSAKLHQLQVSTSATPAAGTLSVSIKTTGASDFATLSWSIDLTDLANQSVFQFTGLVSEIQVTPVGFDGDKTYSVVIATGDRGNY